MPPIEPNLPTSPDQTGAAARPADLALLARHGFDSAVLDRAMRIATAAGVSGVEALLAEGLAEPDAVYRALAAETGLTFLDRAFTVHAQARHPEAVLSGVAPLEPSSGAAAFVYAPRGEAFSALLDRRLNSSLIALTTPDRLREQVFAARGSAIARMAAEDLVRRYPDESFHRGMTPRQVFVIAVLCFALGGAAVALGGSLLTIVSLLASLPFLSLITVKIASATTSVSVRPPRVPVRKRDWDLPVYTILVPLYRERRILPQLLDALRALDYPAARLDVKLLIEADDEDTRSALAEVEPPGFAELIVVPPGEPRGKPRALNVGLQLARGEYVVIYDAEDVPDPNQLRLAVALFEAADPDVACLQARLMVDNTYDCRLTRFFTVEYAALFDVLNPALARFDLPVPLGGTSNHLRADILRQVGGWDAWNVTEDADLAMRLAAAGYRIADLPSVTAEEAPRRLGAWMGQRTRWMKGFLQVSITHSRRPVRNLGRLGLARLLGAATVIFGAVASALLYPVFTLGLALILASGTLLTATTGYELATATLALTLLVTGGLAMIVPALVAIARRRWWSLWPFAILMPFYYLLVSVAAWRGVVELLLEPQRWNKTEHGLARTSRTGLPTGRSSGRAGTERG